VPKQVDREQRRREIAEAVVRIASTRGLQAASMREVAAEAGTSLRLVQYYFHTKDEMLLGTLHHLAGQLSARVEQRVRAAGASGSPRAVLYATLTAIVPTDADSLRALRAFTAFYNLTFTDPTLSERTLPVARAMEDFLTGKVDEAIAAGEVSADLDARMTAAAVMALTNGLGSSVLAGMHDGQAALAILTHHLDRLFGPR
jgi:AcrR family transcriptional regulator